MYIYHLREAKRKPTDLEKRAWSFRYGIGLGTRKKAW